MGEREHLLATAELRLAQRGRTGRLSEVVELSDAERRNLVLRCQLTPSHGPASSVILKQARGDYAPDDLSAWDTQRFFRDWVGAEFLSELDGAPHAPRLLAGDREHGFVVLEDLGHQPSPLRRLLEGSAEQAVLVLEQWILRLARMHGQSAGQLARYDELMAGLQGAPVSALKPLPYFGQDSADKLCAFLGEHELRSEEIGTTRGRILCGLEQYLWLCRQLGGASALHDHAERLLAQLQQRWPDSAPLQLYLAFRT